MALLTPKRAFVLAATVFVFATACDASAAVLRPNALDHTVSALTPGQLMSRPASALVDADRQAAADRLARWELPGWVVALGLQIAVLAYFWRSGAAAMLRDLVRRAVRVDFLTYFVFGGVLAAIARIVTLVPEFYLYRVQRVMEVSDEKFPGWLGDWFVSTLFSVAIAGFIAAVVLWLVDRTRQWYLITIAGILAASLAVAYATPFLIAPIFNHIEPLQGAPAARLHALAGRVGFANIPIELMDRSRRTQTETVTLLGLGPSRRIVVSDTALAASSPGELDFLTARALGHAASGDDFRRALVQALIVILGMALAVFVADRIGFRRDDDPVSRLALVGALLTCAYVVAQPVYTAIDSRMKAQADAYAVRLVGDRSDAVRSFVRLADHHVLSVCPGFFARWYLQNTPSISSRIEQINGVQPPCR